MHVPELEQNPLAPVPGTRHAEFVGARGHPGLPTQNEPLIGHMSPAGRHALLHHEQCTCKDSSPTLMPFCMWPHTDSSSQCSQPVVHENIKCHAHLNKQCHQRLQHRMTRARSCTLHHMSNSHGPRHGQPPLAHTPLIAVGAIASSAHANPSRNVF